MSEWSKKATDNNDRAEKLFEEAEQAALDELNPSGKKNAKHAEDIHDEIVQTEKALGAFLAKQLPLIDTEWKETCVTAALMQHARHSLGYVRTKHHDLENYDLRSLTVVLAYNLDNLTFERNATITPQEVHSVVKIRNAYEHKNSDLNIRNWKKDVETIQVFRSKFQTATEIDAELYSIEELPQMQTDSADYAEALQKIQKQIDSYTEVIFGLERQMEHQIATGNLHYQELEKNKAMDVAQDVELERQRRVDSEQDILLDYQARIDEEHTSALKRNSKLIEKLLSHNSKRAVRVGAAVALSLVAVAVSVAAFMKR